MLVRQDGGDWSSPDVRAYDNEASLQDLIAQSPELLSELDAVPGVTIRELHIPDAGYLDVVVVHVDGSLTLVEAKLNRNPEIRRAVVGQLLGYAGGMWRMSFEDLDAHARRALGRGLTEAAAGLGTEAFDADAFRDGVIQNLTDGAFRLVFAVDEITEDLRRAVEYLNAHTIDSTEVVVVELDYARVGTTEILIPRTFGEEAARKKRASRPRTRWSKDDVIAAVRGSHSLAEVSFVEALLDWAETTTKRIFYGEGNNPSATLVFDSPDGEIQPLTIYADPSSGSTVGINFEWTRKRPEAVREAFLAGLNDMTTVASRADDVRTNDHRRRPTAPLAEIVQLGLERLKQALTDVAS